MKFGMYLIQTAVITMQQYKNCLFMSMFHGDGPSYSFVFSNFIYQMYVNYDKGLMIMKNE